MEEKFNQEINLDNPPNNPGGWEIIAKTLIGLVIGLIISVLIFVILGFTSEIFSSTWMANTSTTLGSHSLSGLLLLFIVFLASFLGNFSMLGFFNLFFPTSYSHGSKTFSILLLANAIILVFLAPMYFIFSTQTDISFLLLAFHMLFSIFVSLNIIEYVSYPLYSISAIIGNTAGFCIVLLFYGVIRNMSGSNSLNQQLYLMILLPAILGYALIPLGLGIWQKIYYTIYQSGSNPFYLSRQSSSQNEDDVSSEEEINIELN